MKIYLIGYDLDKPGQNYTNLIAAIEKAFDTRWHCLDSTWLVKSDYTAVQIRDYLQTHIDASDKLLVATVTKDAAWFGFNKACSDWLIANL